MKQVEARPEPADKRAALFAWAVHAFTASGVVWALLAVAAVIEEQWYAALAWLFIALVVDGVDGTFARWAKVQQRLPRIDGPALDLIIDYLTYVFIPALLIWRAELVSQAAAPWLAGAILVSSLYVFGRRDMKTPDNYFRGFPALWNIVAYYFLLLRPSHEVAAAIIIVLVIATFAPVHVLHPFRVKDYGKVSPLLALVWAISTVALLAPLNGLAARSVLIVSLASAALILALGLLRTFRGPRPSV